MKRIIRIVWISALTGLAFLVACTCHNKMSKQEKKELQNRRSAIVERLDQFQTKDYASWEASLLNPKSDIDLGDRMNGLKTLSQNNQEEIELRKQLHEIDSLLNDTISMKKNDQSLSKAMSKQKRIIQSIENAVPPCVYGPPPTRNDDRMTIQERNEKIEQLEKEQDSIGRILQRREGACVYGSPEVIERYNQETERLRSELKRIHEALLRLKSKK